MVFASLKLKPCIVYKLSIRKTVEVIWMLRYCRYYRSLSTLRPRRQGSSEERSDEGLRIIL